MMTITEAKRSMLLNFTAGVPLKLMGAPGIGKSELAEWYAHLMNEKYADEGGYGFFELNAATANLADVIGFLLPHDEIVTDFDGNTYTIKAGSYSYSYFMRCKFTGRPASTFKHGMFVVEEYGQALGDVKRALAGIIRQRRNGEHKFPEHTDVLLLSNRDTDRSGVSKDFDFVINRLNQQEVGADFDSWVVWAHDNGITAGTIAFANRNRKDVFANKIPEKQGPWMTPRSLVSVDNQVKAAEAMGMTLDDDLLRQNLAGTIGQGSAHIYIAFAKIRSHLPKFSDIVADPQNTRLPTEADQQMFLVYDMATRATKANIKSLITYLNRMPTDFAVAFYRAAAQRDPALISTKEFGDWAVANQQLVAAVNS
jgi:hypothetical protein